jgi:glutathione synthase/RimK-type ligase-like ATP-grasp enzyme
MNVLIASSSKETGALLKEYLEERGAGAGTVCYGLSANVKPVLNENCRLDKIERLAKMREAGVRTIPWFIGRIIPEEIRFPLLARKTIGHGGTDIVPVFQKDEVAWRSKAGWDWFSQYVPVHSEFRVWVFRGEHLDTYEKRMKRPSEYKYIGRNFRNGFDFEPATFQADVFDQASKALKALKLDFGAIDLLRGTDDKVYVLEVNTAPGVIKSGAEKTLGKLADRIDTWSKTGHPTRGY